MKLIRRCTILLAATFILFSCKGQTLQLLYNPPLQDTTIYKLVLASGKLTLTEEVAMVPESNTAGKISFTVIIRQLQTLDGSDTEQADNAYYNNYTGTPLVFEMDTRGNITKQLTYKETGADASQIFDLKMFLPDYPATPMAKGASWNSNRKPLDFMFSKLTNTCTLGSTNDDSVTIFVKSVYSGDSKMFTKVMKGSCIVSKTTGLLQSASLEMSGFNGIGKISGTITITRLR